MKTLHGLVLFCVLALAGCASGLDVNQFCPFTITTGAGTALIQCHVDILDAATADSPAGDAGGDNSSDGDAGADVGVAPEASDAMADAPRDATVDVDAARDARDSATGAEAGAVDARTEAESGPVQDAGVAPPQDAAVSAAAIRGVNDIGFWRGGTDRVQQRNSMVAAGVKYVRIPFANSAQDNGGTDTPAWRAALVDAFLAKGITPIPVAFFSRSGREATGSADPAALSAVVDDWTGADAPWLRTRNVVLNLANEWGPGDPANGANDAGLVVWRDAYISAIQRIRAAGLTMPLLIDAPSGGQNAFAVERWGSTVAAADVLHNTIFSVHVYAFWATANIQSWQLGLVQHFDLLRATGLPIVIGEFSSSEFGSTIGGVPAPADVIAQAQSHGFGWLAWEWFNNSAESIVLDTGGGNSPAAYPPASNLTPFGVTVVTALLGRAP